MFERTWKLHISQSLFKIFQLVQFWYLLFLNETISSKNDGIGFLFFLAIRFSCWKRGTLTSTKIPSLSNDTIAGSSEGTNLKRMRERSAD